MVIFTQCLILKAQLYKSETTATHHTLLQPPHKICASGGGSVGGATTPIGCASWEDIAVDKEPQGHFWKAMVAENAMNN